MDAGDNDSGLRLAELVAAFSMAADLGMGQPMEHILRSWLIAVRLGERLGLGAEARVPLYYVMMLAWVGCVADTAEVATWFGDDIAFRADSYRVDLAGLPMMGFALSHVGAGTPLMHRLRLATNLVLTGGRAVERGLMAHCLTTAQMAARLGLASEVCDPLRQVFTRWDAKGVPEGLGGEEIARSVRLFHLADAVEVFHRAGGVDAAVDLARARRGKHFDPELVDLFCETARDVLADLDAVAECEELIETEPGLCRQLAERELDAVLEAVADFTDLRSPSRAGHSRAVAHLAATAAGLCGLPDTWDPRGGRPPAQAGSRSKIRPGARQGYGPPPHVKPRTPWKEADQVTSPQQPPPGATAHTKPGVHETRDAPALTRCVWWWMW